ncbi:MAG: SH3 domain-containing protein [Bacteroidota bacterium]
MKPISYSILLLFGLFAACVPPGNNPTNPNSPTLPAVDNLVEDFKDLSIEFQELTRPNYVESWVDQLIVKAQPGTNMPEIGRMREGEVATYLKQRTLRKSEFTLRGQRFHEPWILIKTKDSVMGWVHQGGVRFVEPGWLDALNPNARYPAVRTRSMDGTPAVNPEWEKYLISPGKRVGSIKLNTTEEQLVTLFGPGMVSRGTVNTSSVNREAATLIYPNSTDELYLTWKDENRTQVKAVYIDKQGGKWKTQEGLQIGMSLSDLCKINEAPISFYGLDWEYGGTVQSWKKGRLASYEKKFYVVLSPRSRQAAKEYLSKYSGNTVFSSNTVGVDKLDLVVSRIGVYLD